MMRYLPHGPEDRKRMLEAIGVSSVEELLETIPKDLRLRQQLDLPPRLGEIELRNRLATLSVKNASAGCFRSFLGAGAYDHFVPAAVDHLISRTEFYSAYTPYQPEVSQGTLQTIFEFQSMLCMLTGLDVSNASLYDGATATVEALFMAQRVKRRGRLLVVDTVHPEYLETLRTYIRNIDVGLSVIGHGEDGRVDLDALSQAMDEETAAVAVQSPNALGVIERLDRVSAVAAGSGAAAVALVAEPYSLGMLKGPGELGCDVCAGEAQGFGNGLSFGGPYLGFLAAREKYLRQMPGRIAGETVDVEGRRGFVLTLSTREQHIRREKATSNICTNQGLCMTAATIQMALLGRRGLAEVARINHDLAAYAMDRLTSIGGVVRAFSAPFFNEFALNLPVPASQIVEELLDRGVLAGMDLGRWYPEMDRSLLVAVTERTMKEDLDEFARALGEVL